ncbi:MAG TPA: Uma2 family endonuclease [Gemmataceae bacterium]|nr:Uma2 family endonuclease [Gemmataceae bacterium]
MSSIASIGQPPPGGCLRLSGVDWRMYSRLLRAFAERPGIRLTYDRGELEIMSPLLEHDDSGRFLGVLVFVLTEELDMPLKHGGSTTLRRRLKRRGIEADECFWIANARRMSGKRRLDLRTDPPPDLAIEVDVTNSSLDRLGIYGAIKVPEVWRLTGKSLTFYILGPDGSYVISPISRAFPFVKPADLLGFLLQARKAGDEMVVVRKFRVWVRRNKG